MVAKIEHINCSSNPSIFSTNQLTITLIQSLIKQGRENGHLPQLELEKTLKFSLLFAAYMFPRMCRQSLVKENARIMA